jgi:hypothetical protein
VCSFFFCKNSKKERSLKFWWEKKYDLSYRKIQRKLQRKARKTKVEIGSVIFQTPQFRFRFLFLSLPHFFSAVRKIRKLFLNPSQTNPQYLVLVFSFFVLITTTNYNLLRLVPHLIIKLIINYFGKIKINY